MSRIQSHASGIAIEQMIEQATRSATPVEAQVRDKDVVVVVFPQRDYEQWHAMRQLQKIFPTRPPKTPEGYLEDTIRSLRKYEKKYKMTSAEFYRRFQSGELGEGEMDYFDWRVEYNAYRRLKKRVARVRR